MLKKTFLPSLIFLLVLSSYSQNFSKSDNFVNVSANADAVIHLEEYSVELLNQEKMITTYKTSMTIFNKDADYLAKLSLDYDKHTQIKKVNMEFYDMNGNLIKKVKKKDFKDYAAADGFSLYTDNRILHYNYIPISYPYKVYYEYEEHSNNTAFIPSWRPLSNYNVGVQQSNYTLKYASGLKIQSLESNLEGFDISKSKTIGLFTYKTKNIQPVDYETLSVGRDKTLPKVSFASNKFSLAGVNGITNNWVEFGKWVNDELLSERNNLSQETRNKVKKMVEGISDPIKRAEIIYEYVQNKTRYVNVAIGIGGWKPMKTDDVDRLGYGDCKALTFYTKSLLEVAEVPSFYTLVNSDDEKTDIEKKTVKQQGNHAFLCVPTQKDTIWLECTSQKLPFDYINSSTDDREVLVITPDGGKIVHTSTNPSKENLQKTTATYSINSSGMLQGKAEILSYGTQYKNHLYSFEGLTPVELENNMKEHFDFINNLKFSNLSVLNNKKEKRFEEAISFTAESYAVVNTDNSILFTINALNRLTHTPKREKNRKTAFEISRGYLDEDEYTITIPQNYIFSNIIEPVKIENEFGVYTLSIENISDNTMRYKRSFLLHKGVYEKEKYEAYRKFRKQIKKYEKLKTIITQK